MSGRMLIPGVAPAAAPTVLVRHGLRGRHDHRRTHAHGCHWVAGIQKREGHDAGYREVGSAEANTARLGTCRHCGGGEH